MVSGRCQISSFGVRKVSHGARKVSKGAINVTLNAKKCHKVPERYHMVQ